jgi:hypothetical protein
MKKATDYRHHADECRALARTARQEDRAPLLHMAEMWESLAVDREQFVGKHPELSRNHTEHLAQEQVASNHYYTPSAAAGFQAFP